MSRTQLACELDDGLLFRLVRDGAVVPISLPLVGAKAVEIARLDESSFSQLAAIEDLYLDDLIQEVQPGTWRLPTSAVYQALRDHPVAAKTLRFPPVTDVAVHVRTQNDVRHPDFRVIAEVRHPAYGQLVGRYPRAGGLISAEKEMLLLPEPVARLLDHLDRGPGKSPDDDRVADNMLYLARCKALATSAGATMESWLERESYILPESIGLDVQLESDDVLRLVPVAEGVASTNLQEALRRSAGRTSVVSATSGNERHRMILDREDRESIRALSDSSRLTGAEIPQFFDNPEAFVPEGIDLSQFSQRVKGIRILRYNSHPFIRVNRDKYAWFPESGVELHHPQDDDAASRSAPGSEEPQPPPSMDPDTYESLARASLSQRTPYVKHGNAWIHIDPNEASSFLEARQLEKEFRAQGTALPRGAVLEIFQNLESIEFRIDPADSTEDPDPQAGIRDVESFPLPSNLVGDLKPYQRYGYDWLMTLSGKRRGGLLADDMGLGKTIQAIALLGARKQAGRIAPSLVVVRKSLIDNWVEELRRFCPELTIGIVAGRGCPVPEAFARVDVTLLSYETLRRNIVTLGKVDWQVVLCDEAQDIKNPTTGRTDAVKALKSEMRVALTGTPVENGLSELWCIMDFVQPGLLGSLKEFRVEHESPIVRAASSDHRANASRKLLERIVDHYLRRRKADILRELPAKREHRLPSKLSSVQIAQYHEIIADGRSGGRGSMLSALQRLLMLCSFPWPDDEAINFDITDSRLRQCPKLESLIQVLDQVRAANEKALIFADRRTVHRMLQAVVWKRFGIFTNVLNGELLHGRQEVIKQFERGPGFDVLILSPRVGGAGLNITSANHVVHYMRPWNPAIESQATDRTHRIGQTKEVHVYYPIAVADGFQTVEEVLDQLIEDKRRLAADVILPSAEARVSEAELFSRVFG